MTALLAALALAASPFPAQCRAALARAEAASPGQLRELLIDLDRPVVDGRRTELPSLDAAAEDLATPTPEARTAALATLRAICEQAERAEEPAARVDAEALKAILEQPQFAQRRGHEWALGRVLDRLWDVIKELLQQRSVQSSTSVARAAFLVAVALLALYFGLKLVRGRRRDLELRQEKVQEARRSREASVDELLAEARAALERGDARAAVRAQMRAVLAALAARGLTDRRGASTNREIARALAQRGDPELARLAAELAREFDRAIYGGASLEAADAERFAREAEALRTRAGAAP